MLPGSSKEKSASGKDSVNGAKAHAGAASGATVEFTAETARLNAPVVALFGKVQSGSILRDPRDHPRMS